MADIKLNAQGNDIDFVNGALSMTSGIEAHAQRAKMHYHTFLGESRYDRSAGFPWVQIVFNQRIDLATFRMILDIYGRKIPGIEATDLNPTYDVATRHSTVTGILYTEEGDVDFSLEV